MKQVIVANKSINMSPGKLAAMVAHGAVSYFTNWLAENVDTIYVPSMAYKDYYYIKDNAIFDKKIFENWIIGSFTKIILEATTEEMKQIVQKAREQGLHGGVDFFNIVDESTEFESIPHWAVIAFKPMENEQIDPITGHLNLYGHEHTSLQEKDVSCF